MLAGKKDTTKDLGNASSTHMHTMGTDTNMEDQTSTENVETLDDILNGAEYVA
jgi:CO dehydrogenase/acetyl-CoA synthase delta subunit